MEHDVSGLQTRERSRRAKTRWFLARGSIVHWSGYTGGFFLIPKKVDMIGPWWEMGEIVMCQVRKYYWLCGGVAIITPISDGVAGSNRRMEYEQ